MPSEKDSCSCGKCYRMLFAPALNVTVLNPVLCVRKLVFVVVQFQVRLVRNDHIITFPDISMLLQGYPQILVICSLLSCSNWYPELECDRDRAASFSSIMFSQIRKRARTMSDTSEGDEDYHSCNSSLSSSPDSSPSPPGQSCILEDKPSTAGGFSSILTNNGSVKRDIFAFSTKVFFITSV